MLTGDVVICLFSVATQQFLIVFDVKSPGRTKRHIPHTTLISNSVNATISSSSNGRFDDPLNDYVQDPTIAAAAATAATTRSATTTGMVSWIRPITRELLVRLVITMTSSAKERVCLLLDNGILNFLPI